MAHIKHRKGRTWQITVQAGADENGNRIRKYKNWVAPEGMSRARAEKEVKIEAGIFEREMKEQFAAGLITVTAKVAKENAKKNDKVEEISGEMTLTEYSKIFLAQHKNSIAPATYDDYSRMIEGSKIDKEQGKKGRILEALGHKKLNSLTTSHIKAFLDNLREDGINQTTGGKLSKKTQLGYFRLMTLILNTAISDEIIDKNVASKKKLAPKLEHKEIVCMDDVQSKHVLTLLEQAELKYQTLINIYLHCGLRRGEAVGLQWSDINFEKKTMRIRRSAGVVNKEVIVGPPKTKLGRRTISVNDTVLALLKRHKVKQTKQRLQCGDAWVGEDWVFVQWNGEMMYPCTPSTFWCKWQKRQNLPHFSVHSLRHTCATLMAAEGVPPVTAARRLGQTVEVYLSTYAHALPRVDVDASNKMGNVLAI